MRWRKCTRWVLGAGLALVSGLALGACGTDEPAAVPTEEELAIWTEAVLIESALQDFTAVTKDSLATRYYGLLYDRFGIDAADLRELRERYNWDVRLYQVMSDSVEARLQRSAEDPSRLLHPGLN